MAKSDELLAADAALRQDANRAGPTAGCTAGDITCPERDWGTCHVIARMAEAEPHLATVSEGACRCCIASETPRGANYVTASLAIGLANRTHSQEHAATIKHRISSLLKVDDQRPPKTHNGGPGTELTKLLAEFGLTTKTGCGCGSTAGLMDAKGEAWCRDNAGQLAKAIRANASEYGWLSIIKAAKFSTIRTREGRRVARAAISRRPLTNAIKELIAIACERARAEPIPAPPTWTEPPPPPPIQPMRRWRIDPSALAPAQADTHINASIVDWRGQRIMVYRAGWLSSTLRTCLIDQNGNPYDDRPLDVPQGPDNDTATEDPRWFVWRDKLHVMAVGFSKQADTCHTNILCIEVDDERRATRTWAPHYNARRSWEKNWGMFAHGAALRTVYTVAPHHIILEQFGDDQMMETDRTPLPWPTETLGLPRGGAAPQLYRGEYYNWVHTVWNHNGKRHYGIALYTFEEEPPHRPSRILPYVLLTADPADHWSDTHPAVVVFPNGAVLTPEQGIWTVSYGYQDRWIELATWSYWAIEQAMVPIAGSTLESISMTPGWHDKSVWRDVHTGNEYELPERLHEDDIVIDVGGHIGSFACLALKRGAGRVIVCEPTDTTHLRANLAKHAPADRWAVINAAIVATDGDETRQCYDPYERGCWIGKPTREHFAGTPTVTLDSVIATIPAGRRIRWLKLDCEGPEFAIALHSDLSRVDTVCGELHPYREDTHEGREHNWETMQAALERQGFTITKHVAPGQTHLFWASRP